MKRTLFKIVFFVLWGILAFAKEDSVTPKVQIISKIEIVAKKEIVDRYKLYFVDFKDKPIDPIASKLKIDQINRELFNSGYYSSQATMEIKPSQNDTDVIMQVTFKMGQRTNFHFRGNTFYTNQELKQIISERIKNEFGKIEVAQIQNALVEAYEDIGLFDTKITNYTNEGYDLDKEMIKNIFIDIQEGNKIPITKLVFRGNSAVNSAELNKLFYENGSDLIQSHNYDKKYTENFTNILKRHYLSKGFVYVEVSIPHITPTENDSVEIEFSINEKNQVYLSNINLGNIDTELSNSLKQILTNKENQPLNVVAIEDDLKKIITFFQGKGYYFVSISNLNQENILKYDKVTSTAIFSPEISTDHKICYNDIIINGLVKTKEEVILREVDFKKGELITPDKLELIKQKIGGLSLFSNYKVTPYMIYNDKECVDTNLLIQLKEKEFGSIEFTPGYRTDLGTKAALGINYNNFGGMNRTFSLSTQANLRTNLDGFSDTQKINKPQMLESLLNASYTEPYLLNQYLHTQIESETSISWQRKRLLIVDADIFRVSPQLSKNFKEYNLSVSVKWQFERINQYNAGSDHPENNDNYSIGGITPTITYDLRNDTINPKRGAYFSLSSEWANPYFGSMKQSNFEVDYVKIISRNKFYFTVGNTTFATSLAGGYEKNFAKGRYIPIIKVFHLDGYDEIRGFTDTEINRISNGQQIKDLTVTDSASFMVFKFEPRYSINDNLQIDLFFDTGRFYVGPFNPLNLRTSVGAGLKFLTAVGALDLDYGIKLKRENYPDGTRDSFGRFLLSIGFF